MDFVEKVELFNSIAGTDVQFDKRKLCLYIGLVLEECAELIEAFDNKRGEETLTLLQSDIEEAATRFKSGVFDALAEHADRVEVSDAAGDISVVAIGALIANGADVQGTLHNIADSNLSKFPIVDGVHVVLKDSNGKIQKPKSFVQPSLQQFLK